MSDPKSRQHYSQNYSPGDLSVGNCPTWQLESLTINNLYCTVPYERDLKPWPETQINHDIPQDYAWKPLAQKKKSCFLLSIVLHFKICCTDYITANKTTLPVQKFQLMRHSFALFSKTCWCPQTVNSFQLRKRKLISTLRYADLFALDENEIRIMWINRNLTLSSTWKQDRMLLSPWFCSLT